VLALVFQFLDRRDRLRPGGHVSRAHTRRDQAQHHK